MNASSSPPTRLPALDGLRGIAILLVMAFHYEVRYWPWRAGLGTPLWAVIREGWLGVDLFFVLSGFLITGILLDTKEEPGYFRTFYARRALRIFPLYYLYLVVAFFVLPGLTHSQATPWDVQVWFWAYLSNLAIGTQGWGLSPHLLSHFWSLAVEEQFYLIWPAMVLVCNRRALAAVCVAIVVGALAVRWGLRLAPTTWVPHVLTPARADGLALGALVALALRGPADWHRIKDVARSAALASAGIFGALFAWRGLVDTNDVVIGTIGLTAGGLLFASVIAVAATEREGNLVHRLLTIRPLMLVGKYSYAMYVLHLAVRVMLDRVGLSIDALEVSFGLRSAAHIAHIGANTLATFGLAALSWHVVEWPFIRAKDRFRYPVRTRPQEPGSANV